MFVPDVPRGTSNMNWTPGGGAQYKRPRMEDGGMTPNTLQERGRRSGPRVVDTVRLAPFEDGSTSDIDEGCCLFIKVGTKTEAMSLDSNRPAFVNPKNYIVAMMPVHYLNFKLAEKMTTGEPFDVQWVYDNYKFCGVMHTPRGVSTEPNGDRIVTVDRQNIFGKVRNVWGNRIKGGDVLWLICKYVKVDRTVVFNKISTGSPQPIFTGRIDNVALKHPGYLIQFVPHTTRVHYINDEDMCTMIECSDGIPIREEGFAVRVATVVYFNGAMNVVCENGMRNALALQVTPTVEVRISF